MIKIQIAAVTTLSLILGANFSPASANDDIVEVDAYEMLEQDLRDKQIESFLRKVREAENSSTGVPRFVALPAVTDSLVEPLLINGRVVDPVEFPGVLRMITGGTCTATLVGPRTMYFAAHCMDYNYSRIEFMQNNTVIGGICEQAPGYQWSGDQDDWALCLMEKPIDIPGYESLDLDTAINIGEKVILSGYGCTERGGAAGTVLRIGESERISVPPELKPEQSTIFTRSKKFEDGAILCPGDSGGPAFRMGDTLSQKRSVVGVNSRTTYEFGVSLVAATASPRGNKFVRSWATKHNQKICGLNKSQGCR